MSEADYHDEWRAYEQARVRAAIIEDQRRALKEDLYYLKNRDKLEKLRKEQIRLQKLEDNRRLMVAEADATRKLRKLRQKMAEDVAIGIAKAQMSARWPKPPKTRVMSPHPSGLLAVTLKQKGPELVEAVTGGGPAAKVP